MSTLFKTIRNVAMRLGISAPESDDDIYDPALFSLIDKRIQYLGIHSDKQQERINELSESLKELSETFALLAKDEGSCPANDYHDYCNAIELLKKLNAE